MYTFLFVVAYIPIAIIVCLAVVKVGTACAAPMLRLKNERAARAIPAQETSQWGNSPLPLSPISPLTAAELRRQQKEARRQANREAWRMRQW